MMISLYLFQLIRQRRFSVAFVMFTISTAIIAGAFTYAYILGGENLLLRFSSIAQDNPGTFYYQNRGNQVAYAFLELLPQYPFGAGLGRWGMMNLYFGDTSSTASLPIWVEIQWPAWIVDGGIFLLITYPVALLTAMKANFILSSRRAEGQLRDMAAIILATNVGLFALTFSYPVFASAVGMQFWFLAGALHGLAQRTAARVGKRPAAFGSVRVQEL
jgi:hypothetical protein